MTLGKRAGRALSAIVAVGLGLRLAVLIWYLSTHGWRGETWEYEVAAQRLLAGEGLSFPYLGSVYRSYYVPLFPMLCAAFHWIAGPGLSLYYAVQLACSAGIMFLIFRIASGLWGNEAGLYAAGLVALEPGLILYQSYKVDPATISSLLVLVAMAAFLRVRAGAPRSMAIGSGLAAGFSILTRPDAVAFFAAPIAWVIWQRLRPLKAMLLLLTAAILPLLPWVGRNYLIHGRIMATSSLPGQLLWTGNNPESTGTLWTRSGIPQVEAAPAELHLRLNGAGEIANHDVYREAALRYISADPIRFLVRCAEKTWYFWWFPPDYSGSKYYRWLPGTLFYGYRFYWLGIVALALFGSWKASDKETSLIFWAAPIALSAIHCLYYVEGRHRLLILPLILVLAARGLMALRPNENAA